MKISDFKKSKEEEKIYKGKGDIICKICSSTFARNSVLKEHVAKIHNDDRTIFRCGCKKLYFKEKYDKHIKVYHSNNTKHFKCEKCEKLFRFPFELNLHLQVHNPKNLECGMCHKMFHRKLLLQQHIRHKHTKREKEYNCQKCPKSFYVPISLKNHMVRHTDDPKPFKCQECEKSFSTNKNLELHMVNHSDDNKPFKCEICPAEYSRKGSLREHMYSHTDDPRPFKCKICDIGFTKSGNLYHHAKKKHNTEYIEIVKKGMEAPKLTSPIPEKIQKDFRKSKNN